MRLAIFTTVLVTFASGLMPAQDTGPLPVLLVTGQNNHDWEFTSKTIEEQLEKTGRFDVTITTTPSETLADATALKKYAAIVLDYNGKRWAPAAERTFLAAVEGGVGVTVVHAANNAFDGWVEFETMVCLCWRGGTGHGRFHAFDVRMVDRRHPITDGMPDLIAHPDELYHRLVPMHGASYDILATAHSAKESGGTGEDEPMILVSKFGKGRIFHTPLGHVWRGREATKASFRDPQLSMVIARGTEWAATGEVTLTPESFGLKSAPKEGRAVVGDWLVLPPATASSPAFADEKPGARKLDDLLSEVGPRPDARPAAGDRAGSRRWASVAAGDRGVELKTDAAGVRESAAAISYFHLGRFAKTTVRVAGDHPMKVLVDGEEVGRRTDGTDAIEKTLPLDPGPHTLMVVTIRDAGDAETWRVHATLRTDRGAPPAVSASARRALDLDTLLEGAATGSVSLSPDGRHVAHVTGIQTVDEGGRESWLEIRETATGRVVSSHRGIGRLSGFQWGPNRDEFAFTASRKDQRWLYAGHLGGAIQPVLDGVKDLGSFRWMPDGTGFIYSVTEKEKLKHEGKGKRRRGLADRWATYRHRARLWHTTADGSTRRRLTAGGAAVSLEDIRPDGKKALISRTDHDRKTRPFSAGELFELDLDTLEARRIATVVWLGSALYAPDGASAFVSAGPSAFDGIGKAVAEGTIPNDYDTQLFSVDLATLVATPLTRAFDPAIQGFVVATDGSLIARAQVGARVAVFRRDPSMGAWHELSLGMEVISGLSVSTDGRRVEVLGSSAGAPPTAAWLTIDEDGVVGARGVWKTESPYQNVALGDVRDFSFTASNGTVIPGRVHLPPDFDASRRYPAIVYFYGGTVPTSRGFGGRYPKNLWAAHGYVVYVLQPSGATGYGQEFSARHVNNWGATVADEIVDGTRAFLAAHRFVDPTRVGCIGASYGGFMTMLLLSRTDVFATGISHAGISSISSYWGEGWWGYSYSAVASADSYPWNRPDLYIGQSALFQADKIQNPLLLLHGAADTNVPPGESEQLYTALKVLDREVEFVTFDGENHWILDPPKRRLWARTIVAWFDRQLKGEPGWWDHLWK